MHQNCNVSFLAAPYECLGRGSVAEIIAYLALTSAAGKNENSEVESAVVKEENSQMESAVVSPEYLYR